ncbi:hypothetical protein KQX54_008336 [Cotesia glomerata]|uniref:Uncharacterized protein n=1 Tax=Cotesia glomerata TaxID=32391 RepID=A0AAV7IJI8_COTGL|nr:hypothetical protein KQX54_008336 [Cotesia glomerata]
MEKLFMVDFTGYYFNNQFIIKEFSRSKVLENHRIRSLRTSLVTKPPVPDLLSQSHENIDAYQNFYNTTGIEWTAGSLEIAILQREIKHKLKKRKIIYVETVEKAEQLISFLGKRYSNIRPLDSFKQFNFRRSGLTSDCRVHNGANYQCAYSGAIELAAYVFDNDILVQDNQSAVIDLNGYYDEEERFILKELSIIILNPLGFITYSNTFVAKPMGLQAPDTYDVYFKKYGIPWNAGDYDLSHIFNEVNDVIARSGSLKVIFVRNIDIKSILMNRIISAMTLKSLTAQIVCLDEINYKKMVIIVSDCRHYTNNYYFGDKCAGDYSRHMMALRCQSSSKYHAMVTQMKLIVGVFESS